MYINFVQHFEFPQTLRYSFNIRIQTAKFCTKVLVMPSETLIVLDAQLIPINIKVRASRSNVKVKDQVYSQMLGKEELVLYNIHFCVKVCSQSFYLEHTCT